MGTVTINIDEETERAFRDEVKEHVGSEKGSLGKAVTEALHMWVAKKKQEDVARELSELMDRGFEMGKIKIKHRSELYGRD